MAAWQQGFEVIFMAPESRRHHGRSALEAVIDEAHGLGITRLTRRAGEMSAGEDGHRHSAHFFELADRPEEVMFVLEPGMADRLVEAVAAAGIPVFCLRRPVEFAHPGH